MDYLLRGILIGLLFGLPVGAVGALTVQRTFSHGAKAGLLTGLGSSVADCFYACVGTFGLTLISDFLLRYQTVINLLGGGLILFLGIRLLLRREEPQQQNVEDTVFFKMFLTSFAVGITNPAANPDLPVCFFLLWNFGQCGMDAGAGAGLRCFYRDLSLVGRSYKSCRYCEEKSKTLSLPAVQSDLWRDTLSVRAGCIPADVHLKIIFLYRRR